MTIKEFKIQYALGSLTDDMKLFLANNSNTPIEVLTILSTDEDSYVRCNIANNSNTPIEVLKILSKDKHWNVRYRAVNTQKKMRMKSVNDNKTTKIRFVRDDNTLMCLLASFI